MSSGLNGSVDSDSYKTIEDWSIMACNVGTITGIIGRKQILINFIMGRCHKYPREGRGDVQRSCPAIYR